MSITQIKPVQGRWMTIDEEIYEALDIYTMSLYTALRYESDFSQEASKVIRSLAYLCERAKISKRQGFKSLNILEELGLIKRCNENRLGEMGLIYVSKHIGHFLNIPVHTMQGGVHTMQWGVHHVHTLDQESLQEPINKHTLIDKVENLNTIQQKSDETFELFWELYPKKKNKNMARHAWLSQRCYDHFVEINKKLKEQIEKDSDFLDGMIPNPDKYIFGERWKDEIVTRKQSGYKTKTEPLDFSSTSWADKFKTSIF